MRLLKWLFQPAYLLLIIVVVALYVNREAMFPEQVAESLEAEVLVAKVEGLVERLRSDSDGLVAEEDKAEAIVLEETPEQDSASSVVEDEEPVELTTDTESQNDVVQNEPAQSDEVVQDDSADVPAISDAVAETSTATAEAAIAATDEPAIVQLQPTGTDEATTPADADVITTVEPESAPVDSDTIAAPQAADSDTLGEEQQADAEEAVSPLAHWKAARAAVWQGDLAGAVSSYQKLITAQPDNYDAYGEMGNVLLAQSNAQAAADAYATAASLIYRSGNRQMAYRVATIVMALDPARGQALEGEFARQ